MTRKRIGWLALLAALAVTGSVMAHAGVIEPNEVTVNVRTSFSFSGDGTPVEWCVIDPGDSEDDQVCSSSSSLRFTKTGTGYVRVKVDLGAGEVTKTETVTVNAAD